LSQVPVQRTLEDREQAWLLLADLFFLDTEPTERDYQYTAQRLTQMGVGCEEAEHILIYEVAPVAGANLGYLLYPVIGVWDGFDAGHLCGKIGAYVERRAGRPQWHYFLQDGFMRWMVRQLEPEKLWSRM
jgi:hypothetical protein